MPSLILKLIVLSIALSSGLLVAQDLRPQEPSEPFNYTTEEITFENSAADGIVLAGTLSLPNDIKKPTVAILISGSGPQDRNSEILGHKPFLVLADYLSSHGIAVLRFDDRGTAASGGDFSKATSFDFATDVEAAISYLRTRSDINKKNIGLIGHSEGGLIAPIVASRQKNIAFVVLLAGPGIPGDEILYTQNQKIMSISGTPAEAMRLQLDINKGLYDIIKKQAKDSISVHIDRFLDAYEKKHQANSMLPYLINDASKKQFQVYSTAWLREFIRFDPQPYLSKISCPVLAINGEKDVQVVPDQNLKGIKIALEKAKNKDVTVQKLMGLNHLFQTCDTGMPQEYKTIEETFAPVALALVKDWILARF